MRRLTALFFTCLVGSFVGAAAPLATQEGFTGPGCYRIEIVATGKVLDLRAEDKKTVQQWAGGGARNQEWEVEDAGGGYYYVKSVATGNVLDFAENKVKDGVGVSAARRGGSDNQKRKIAPAAHAAGQFTIISKSGKSLEAPAGRREDGARLQVWGPHGLENQRFKFTRVGDLGGKAGPREPHAATPTSRANNSGFLGKGRYQIQSVASGHFLDLRREDKQTLQQWSGSGALNQQWDVEEAGGGYFYLRSVETGKVLEATNTRDGSAVLARGQQTGRDHQKWRVVDVGNGQSLIVARSGKVLDVIDNVRNEGARVQIWGEHRGDNQRFSFNRVETTNRYVGGRTRDASAPPVPPRGPVEEPYAPGRMRWRGRVDAEVLLEVRSNAVTERLVTGQSFNNGRYTFTAPLPRRELNLRLEKRKVRGAVEIVERPSAANNYAVVIRLSDPQRDAADYEFELIW